MAHATYVPSDGPVHDLGRVVVPIRKGESADDPTRTVLVLALNTLEAQWLDEQVNRLAICDPIADRIRMAVLIAS